MAAAWTLLLVLTLIPSAARPEESLAQSGRTLVVVGDKSYAPLEFADNKGHARGLMVDVWRLWSQKTGVKVDYRVAEWSRALEMVRRGQADVVGGLFFSVGRAQWLDFGEPYYSLPTYIYFQKGIPGLKGPEDLAGFKVGVVRDDFAESWLKANAPEADLAVYPGTESLVKAALAGKIKVFVSDGPVARFQLSRLGNDPEFQQSSRPLYTMVMRPGVAKGKAELLALVNRGMSMISRREIDLLRAQWAGTPARDPEPWSWFVTVLAVAGLLVGGVVVWNRQLQRRVGEATASLRRQQKALADSEQTARASEEKYRHLLENQVDLVAEVDREGYFIFVSPSLVELSGLSRKVLLSKSMHDLLRPEDRETLSRGLEALGRPPHNGRLEMWTRTRRGWRWLAWTARGVLDTGGNLRSVVAVGRDITTRKRIEEERRRLAAAVEQSSQGVVIADLAGIVEYVNPAFERLTGLGRQEVVGLPEGLTKAMGQEGGLPDEARRAVLGGEVWRGRFTAHKKEGLAYEAEVTVSPIRDSGGRPARLVVLTRDVTHETMLERQLRQIQKMEAIGTLAGGIAHDFNNLLLAVVGYTELAIKNTPPEAASRPHLDQVLTACRRARDLVRQILAFSRGGDAQPLPVSLGDVVEEALNLLDASLPDKVEVVFRPLLEQDTVLADPTQLHQVLINLCSNAAYAMREAGGRLELGIEAVEEAPLQEPLPQGWLKLWVADNGPGIPAEAADRLFEPFFTTKPLGEGTGMGLAVVHGVVRALGGFVQVANRPQGGALFEVYLPRSGEASSPDRRAPRGELPTGGERVLLVDDEKALADMTRELLSELGYRAESFHEPFKAWERFQADPEAWDLVISDQSMPGLSGDQLIARMRRLRPELPVLLTSGHQQNRRLEKFLGFGSVAFLPKPFNTGQLAREIRKVLDGGEASG